MLTSLYELSGYTLLATDGEIGRAKDFLFDEQTWVVRYLVADTGKWLEKQKVLISPVFVDAPDEKHRHLPVDLTRKTIEGSPRLDEHAPVSRRKEMEFYTYYQIPPYWVGPRVWGVHPTLDAMRAARKNQTVKTEDQEGSFDSRAERLRSVSEVTGYYIAASDDDIGHVEDFVADTSDWSIRWLVVDTRNWLPGRKVLVAPGWAESVSWDERKLHLTLTAEQIRNSPEFDASEPIDEQYESELDEYYVRTERRQEARSKE